MTSTSLKRTFILLITSTAVASAAPILRLSTAAFGPIVIAQSATGTTQTVQASNIGDGTLNLSVSVTATWLQATVGTLHTCPTGGGNCFPISIGLNTGSLAAGTYTGFVNVSDPNAVDSPQNISVTVAVGNVPNSLEFYTAPGGTTSSTIYTHQGGSPVFMPSTATGGNWLSVHGAGTYDFFYSYQVLITAQPGQGAGDYTGAVVVTGSNTASDNKTVGVTLHVTTSPIAVPSPSSVALITGQGSKASQSISVANMGQGSLSISGATPATISGSGWLSATVNSGTVSVTADATSLVPGSYQGTITLNTNAANNAALVLPVYLLVTTSTGPQINFGGVVDNAIGQGSVAPGDIVATYGVGFSPGVPALASAVPLPVNIGGTQVTVNGVPAPLYYTSANQLDIQIPYETQPGLAIVQVSTNGTLGNSASVQVVARSPRVLVFSGSVPIIINQDGSVPVATTTVLPNHPANRGDTLVIYAIGLGTTDPATATGVGAPAVEPLARVDQPVNVMLGGGFTQTANITPLYVGLTPNFVGLYQINVTIPQNAPVGNSIPLTLNVQGQPSPPVDIAIQ